MAIKKKKKTAAKESEPQSPGIGAAFSGEVVPEAVKEKSVADEIREHLKEAQRLLLTLDWQDNARLQHGKVLLDGFIMSCVPLVQEGLREMRR